MPISNKSNRTARPQVRAAILLPLLLPLAACASTDHRMLDSVHQPVISHAYYTFDVATTPDGLSTPEQHRLADWFESMDLRYGDKLTLDDPLASDATRASVETVAGRYGILLSRDVPVTQGYVNAGNARIILARAVAEVPHCPEWNNSATNLANATSNNYGCAVNSNLAAMIANPDDMLKGARNQGETSTTASDRAVATYRAGATPKPSAQSTK